MTKDFVKIKGATLYLKDGELNLHETGLADRLDRRARTSQKTPRIKLR